MTTRDLVPGGFFYLSIAILFVSFGFILLSQSIWDYDFWWHIATGRYIVETGTIPTTDPFSFSSQLPENHNLYPDRERFIMTQYWLAQVFFYKLYAAMGPLGIGLMRSLTLLLSVYVVYRALKQRDVMPYVSFVFIFIAFVSLLKFWAERPVLFTILGTVAVFVILDNFERKRSKAFFALPLVMLLWANLHGGFIIGDAIIIVFVVAECAKVLLNRSSFSTRGMLFFFGVALGSVAISGINPNGFLAVYIAFSKEFAPFTAGIQEYQSPYTLYTQKLAPLEYAYLAVLFLAPVVLFLRNRRFNPTHLLLLLCFGYASITAGRYTAYYCLIACIVLGNELNLWLKEQKHNNLLEQRWLGVVFSVAMLASSVLYGVNTINVRAIQVKESPFTAPINAAKFMKQNNLKGNVLNSFDNGGYLAWKLYPDVKTFIDTRALNMTVMKEFAWMASSFESLHREKALPGRKPLWKRLIDHYKIDYIVFSPFDVYGAIPPLLFTLMDDDEWALVYFDVVTPVFVRNISANRALIDQYRVPKDEFYNKLLFRAIQVARDNARNPVYMESIGDVFAKMGKRDDAIKAYEYSIRRREKNDVVRTKLAKLKEEEEKKDE